MLMVDELFVDCWDILIYYGNLFWCGVWCGLLFVEIFILVCVFVWLVLCVDGVGLLLLWLI